MSFSASASPIFPVDRADFAADSLHVGLVLLHVALVLGARCGRRGAQPAAAATRAIADARRIEFAVRRHPDRGLRGSAGLVELAQVLGVFAVRLGLTRGPQALRIGVRVLLEARTDLPPMCMRDRAAVFLPVGVPARRGARTQPVTLTGGER